MAGAKGKYSPQLIKEIYSLIEQGVPAVRACEAVGIGESTFYEWKETFPEFAESIKKYKAKAITKNVKNVLKAAEEPKNWTASAWFLERRDKDNFALKENKQPPNQYNQFNLFNVDKDKTARLKEKFKEILLNE